MVPQMAGARVEPGGGWWLGRHGEFSVREVVLMSRYAAHVEDAGSGISGSFGRLAAMGFETEEVLPYRRSGLRAGLRTSIISPTAPSTPSAVANANASPSPGPSPKNPPCSLLDEPNLRALDLHHQLELISQLEELTAQAGHLIIAGHHDLNLAARFATRVAVMDQGHIVADGLPQSALTPAVLEPRLSGKVREQGDGTLRFDRMLS